jgi:hypothetical protein
MRRVLGWCALAAIFGCSSPPVVRLQDCAERNRALTSELALLRDQVSRLKTDNAELAERNRDDAERISALELERRESGKLGRSL